jgi:acetyltransferase-like isoleucine patch superfamily enzyme
MNLEPNTSAPESQGLRARIRRSWERDSHLSLARRIRKGLNFIGQLMRAHSALKDCDRVGASARVAGRLRVENRGSIVIGDHLNVNSSWVPIELVTGSAGRIEIGDDVLINFGTVVAAGNHVSIGSGTMIGPHCIISDVDIPETLLDSTPVAALPIEIGKGVWLAGRVTLRPGVKLGDGAVIVAGSIVETDVPAHYMASGIPARPLPRLGAAPQVAIASPAVLQGTNITGTDTARLRGSLISNFRLDDLLYELSAGDGSPPVDAEILIGERVTSLLAAPARADARDFLLVWTQPEATVPAFARLLNGESIVDQDLEADVDAFCALVVESAARYRYVLLPTWTQPPHVRGLGVLDGRPGGILSALTAMNLRMMKAVQARANVFVLDAARWQAAVGPAGFNPRAWYLGGMVMARPLIAEAARDIRAALATLSGRQRSLLVFRQEDALWTDAAADGTSAAPLEQAYTAFQQALCALRRGGVLLALIGSATKSEMLEAIRAIPNAVVREDDFAGFGAAEGDEAAKIAALAARFGVGLNAVVYVDARDSVRTRLRTVLHEVYIPDWPADKLMFPSALAALRCFDPGSESAVERRACNE